MYAGLFETKMGQNLKHALSPFSYPWLGLLSKAFGFQVWTFPNVIVNSEPRLLNNLKPVQNRD